MSFVVVIKSLKKNKKYQQSRSFIHTTQGKTLIEPESINLEKCKLKPSQGGVCISCLYNMINNSNIQILVQLV